MAGDASSYFGTLDDRRAYVAAATAMARADEALAYRSGLSDAWHAVLRRREAVAIAGLEGTLVRVENLCRLIVDPDITGMDRGSRRAFDVHGALHLAEGWTGSGPSPDEVAAAFKASDASSGRLARPETEWTIEEDSEWLSSELRGFAENPEPWSAAETLRLAWTSGRFFGNSRRMALVVAPWLAAKGFGCAIPAYGYAPAAALDPEGLREDARGADPWSMRFAGIVGEAGKSARAAVTETAAIRATLVALCPPGRSTSSVEKAVDFMFERPVFTARAMTAALDLTDRGAKVVLDRLLDAGAVETDLSARNRKFTCRRTM